MESLKRTLTKTITYRFFQLCITTMLLYAMIGKAWTTLQIALCLEICKTVAYFVHERIWANEPYGRVYKHERTLWFTGLSGSGKSTIANGLAQRYREQGRPVTILDGDEIRKTINKDLGFSAEDRTKNIERIAHIAEILNRAGVICIVPVICPYDDLRKLARNVVTKFTGVYVKCPIEVCEGRDPKGLYAKVRSGEIKKFTGISDPYEEPTDFEITVDTNNAGIEESINTILEKTHCKTRPDYLL